MKTFKVTVIGSSGKSKPGNVNIQHWDKRARIVRSLKALGLCWGLAVVSILIPIAHFILVPGFFIAGPIWAFFVSGQESTVLGGESTCPECNSPLNIVKGNENWPLKDKCEKCFADVSIEKE